MDVDGRRNRKAGGKREQSKKTKKTKKNERKVRAKERKNFKASKKKQQAGHHVRQVPASAREFLSAKVRLALVDGRGGDIVGASLTLVSRLSEQDK